MTATATFLSAHREQFLPARKNITVTEKMQFTPFALQTENTITLPVP